MKYLLALLPLFCIASDENPYKKINNQDRVVFLGSSLLSPTYSNPQSETVNAQQTAITTENKNAAIQNNNVKRKSRPKCSIS